MSCFLHAFRGLRSTGFATVIWFLVSVTHAHADVPDDRLRRLDEYLMKEVAQFNLPGIAFAVTSNGKIIHEKIHGEGIHSDSAFVIGSCSKTITALATLIALDSSNVDVNSSVQDVLPGLEVRGSDEPLKIVQLLQHRSGLVRSQGFDNLPSLEDLEHRGYAIQLQHPPGRRFDYCNLNYSLLGLIVEKLSGRPFGDFVESDVFVPAGMHSSSCSLQTHADKFAPEYQYCFGFARQVKPTEVPASRIPSGFIRCSARDLARLQLVLSQDGVLDGQQVFSRTIIQQMKTPPDSSGFGYGMGVFRGNHHYGPVIAHEGATPTAYAFHGLLTDDNLGVVLLININLFDPFTDHGESMYENMFRILRGDTPQRIYPFRIWVRWLIVGAVLLTGWQLCSLLMRWRKSGWHYQMPTSRKERISLGMQIVAPLIIWYAILRWTQTPFLTALEMEPDVMWCLVFLTAAGIFTGCLKHCVAPHVFKRQSPESRSLGEQVVNS